MPISRLFRMLRLVSVRRLAEPAGPPAVIRPNEMIYDDDENTLYVLKSDGQIAPINAAGPPGPPGADGADGAEGPRGDPGLPGALPDEPPSNGIIYGRRDGVWVDMTAPANLQFNRGTSSEVAAYTPLIGEPVWDTTHKRLVVGDGSTAGGVPVGYPVVVGVTVAYNPGISTTAFIKPTVVTLAVPNSMWHVRGACYLAAVDFVETSLVVKIAVPGTISGNLTAIRASDPATLVYSSNMFNASAPITLPQLDSDADSWFLQFDCIVYVASTTLEWGLEFAASAAGHAATVSNPDNNFVYARRLA